MDKLIYNDYYKSNMKPAVYLERTSRRQTNHFRGLRRKSAFCSLVFLLMVTFNAHAVVKYSVTDIGVLLGFVPYGSSGLGINDYGDVAITAGVHANTNKGFLYSGGVTTDLGPGNAYDVNNQGQVAGYRSHSPSSGNAYIYSAGTVTELGFAMAFAINNNGQLAGISFGGNPCIYSNGTVSILTSMSGAAFGLNDRGDVVGQLDNSHAFLYTEGNIVDLGNALVGGINNSGHIVGEINGRGFRYAEGNMADLGAWAPVGINDNGLIVGYDHFSLRAYLYDEGKLTDLNDLISPNSGMTLNSASSINNNGQITGFGTTLSGETHAFLLTPVPEPNALLIVVMSGTTFVYMQCRSRIIRSK